jgi:deazaflavin-dependent oxidoreductase (nitroreductase family)
MNQPRYSRWVRPAAKALARAHRLAYRASDGRVGGRWGGASVAWITTTGRRSGRPRTTPVVCLPEADGLAIVASNGGSDRPPDWWLNLQHQPRAEVEVNRTQHQALARRATAAAEDRIAARFEGMFPQFARYRARTQRDIPVVILELGDPARSLVPVGVPEAGCNPVGYLAP